MNTQIFWCCVIQKSKTETVLLHISTLAEVPIKQKNVPQVRFKTCTFLT